MKTCLPYSVKIYCGLKEGYDGLQHSINHAYELCQEFCDKVGLGVTVSPTHFIYKDGNEDGVVVGLINYPRFPKFPTEIDNLAIKIAEILMVNFKQQRVTIETPQQMIMLEQGDKFEELNIPGCTALSE